MCSLNDVFAIGIAVFVIVAFVGCVYWLIKNI
jgi:hypothetical protein